MINRENWIYKAWMRALGKGDDESVWIGVDLASAPSAHQKPHGQLPDADNVTAVIYGGRRQGKSAEAQRRYREVKAKLKDGCLILPGFIK